MTTNVIFQISKSIIIRPKHKRTEGRAPVWDSEFIRKAATLQGGSANFAARLNVKLWDLTGGD
jgi:hypothetical protein